MTGKTFLHWIEQNAPFFVAFALAVCALFWLPPGVLDVGGDSTRLYFYDPAAFLSSVARFTVVPEGKGIIEANYFYWPFVGSIAVLVSLTHSPWAITVLFHMLKISGAFLGMYLLISRILIYTYQSVDRRAVRWVSITAVLLYVFSPPVAENWEKAITSHYQVVTNPVMLYLFVEYVARARVRYLIGALLFSFWWAPAFSLTSAPPFFAFYPLAFLYIVLLNAFVWRRRMNWAGLAAGMILALGLHAFHLLPQLMSLFDPGSFANTRVFDRTSIASEGVRYFYGVLPLASIARNILYPILDSRTGILSMIPFAVLLLGLRRVTRARRAVAITAVMFLISLYLLSAHVGNAGIELYEHLFYLPGFSMFRNFIGQWSWIYMTFFVILIAFAWYEMYMSDRGKRMSWAILFSVLLISLCAGIPLLDGQRVKPMYRDSSGMRVGMKMDPRYEKFLDYIRNLPQDGKIATVPLTDAFYQVLRGMGNGAYIGSSTVSYLTDAQDFAGYQLFAPYSETVKNALGARDGRSFVQVLSLFNIRYIFHNTDPWIFEKGFPRSPYTYMNTSQPTTQKLYTAFLETLPVSVKHTDGPYVLYEIDDSRVRPLLYVPDMVDTREATEAAVLSSTSDRSVFVSSDLCHKFPDECASPGNQSVIMTYDKITPSSYTIRVKNIDRRPFILVFSQAFNNGWILTRDGSMDTYAHVLANGYANAWMVGAGDRSNQTEYTMTLKLDSQKYFTWGLYSTALSLGITLCWIGVILWQKRT